MAGRRRADLGRPSTAVTVKPAWPRRLSGEDPNFSFETIALPAPSRSLSQGALPSRSTSCSSRGPEDLNWEEISSKGTSSVCSLAGSVRSQPGALRRSRWEPHFSPMLPRPVPSGSRPLRRPSSAALRYDDLVAQAEAARDAPVLDLKQLLVVSPRIPPLSEIFERVRPETRRKERKKQDWEAHRPEKASCEEPKRKECESKPEAKLHEVSLWEFPGDARVRPGLSPISECTETDKATPSTKPEAKVHAWAEVPPLPQAKDLELPEEMLAPEERSPYRLNPSPLRKTEAPSAQIRNIVRSMEEDEHLAWLARMGPAPRPFTLEETLQEMAVTIAMVDAQLLGAHPPPAEATVQPAQPSRSPDLHVEEEPRAPKVPEEIAGELLVKSPSLDTVDTASGKEDAPSGGVGSGAPPGARFHARRSPSTTPRPSEAKGLGSRSRVSSQDSNAFSDVSFFGQSSVGEPVRQSRAVATGNHVAGAAGSAAKPTQSSAAATPKTLVECALCGRRKGCQPGSCFCFDCAQRMNQADPGSPSSGESIGPPRREASGPSTFAEAACVICGQGFKDGASSSVLCPQCLRRQR